VEDLEQHVPQHGQLEPPGDRSGPDPAAGCEQGTVSCYGLAVQKLLLLSILLATFLLPALAAQVKSPRRALESLLAAMLLFEVGYAVFLYAIYPRL